MSAGAGGAPGDKSPGYKTAPHKWGFSRAFPAGWKYARKAGFNRRCAIAGRFIARWVSGAVLFIDLPAGEPAGFISAWCNQHALILRVHDCQTSTRSATGVGFHTVLAILPVLAVASVSEIKMAKLQGTVFRIGSTLDMFPYGERPVSILMPAKTAHCSLLTAHSPTPTPSPSPSSLLPGV